jgi:N-acetylglucosamine kinase-like BadF-type ATPase
MSILIADSGSTKTQWCWLQNGKKKKWQTSGLSPYFLSQQEMQGVVLKGLGRKFITEAVSQVFFYGTGCAGEENNKQMVRMLKQVFKKARIVVKSDLFGAAIALCGNEKGVACILGTGSNSCFFNGKKIVSNSPGLGYVLGDEGSGASMGKKLLQYFLYNTMDADLYDRFKSAYPNLDAAAILDAVYRKPLPNRYLASFTPFLADNRGHFMVENIIEDAFAEFFFQHLFKYRGTWTSPVHFTGSIAYVFRDVLKELCHSYEIKPGKILKDPMEGLIGFHSKK